MDLKTWCEAERGRASKLADEIGISVAFLSQILSGDRPLPAQHSHAVERATDLAVRRWDLRPADWHLLWPELLEQDGAPQPTAKAEA